MDNRKFIYLAEGECEEKLLKALRLKPSLIHPGKVEKFNVIQNELPIRKLMQFPAGCVVVLVFDTDKDVVGHLKENIRLLRALDFKVEVLTVVQVFNFEDEIERSTNVRHALDITRSKTLKDFKSAVNGMKDTEFRNALKRHKLDMGRLWTENPPKNFKFVKQESDKVKESE